MDFREYTIGEVREMVIKEYGENIPENQWIAYGYLKKKLDLSGPDSKWLPQNVYKGRLELILEVLDV
jgi:hypothetical protein|tara:strand:- start:507 stop:707 length:201 start_codon:yes stop_codon:yes gene_type:complete